MGVTKHELFSVAQNDLATVAKALAHPARVAILEHLLKINQCICGDLVQELGLAQPTISQHLRELKNAGIIQGTIEGTSVCYCIHPDRWQEISKQFTTLFNQFKTPTNGCC